MATPGEEELIKAVMTVRDAHPDLGILKLWAQLKTDKPEWAVSEKRFRKVLAAAGGTATGTGAVVSESSEKPKSKKKNKNKKKSEGSELVAQTGIDPSLDVSTLAPKVSVNMFGGTKGKGLVAESAIQKGEVLWQEEPWIACPDPKLKPHLASKTLCTHCLTQFAQPNPPLSVECPNCPTAHFCNRLCLSRAKTSASHHELLCEGVNPSAAKLNALVAANEWRSLDIVARIIAKWRGERAWGTASAAAEIEQRVWNSIARVNMETRESEKSDWPSRKESTERLWRSAHQVIVDTLNPSDAIAAKKFQQILTSVNPKASKAKPLSESETKRWFSYESFLELLGMININLEDSGGMYALHAHMNHSCDPNIQVRNLPKSFVPPTTLPAELPERNPPGVRGTHKLTMLARDSIPEGTELSISYVDLSLPRAVRRQALRDGYGFWCECPRCQKEKDVDGTPTTAPTTPNTTAPVTPTKRMSMAVPPTPSRATAPGPPVGMTRPVQETNGHAK